MMKITDLVPPSATLPSSPKSVIVKNLVLKKQKIDLSGNKKIQINPEKNPVDLTRPSATPPSSPKSVMVLKNSFEIPKIENGLHSIH